MGAEIQKLNEFGGTNESLATHSLVSVKFIAYDKESFFQTQTKRWQL